MKRTNLGELADVSDNAQSREIDPNEQIELAITEIKMLREFEKHVESLVNNLVSSLEAAVVIGRLKQ